jgi:hypothetical protein
MKRLAFALLLAACGGSTPPPSAHPESASAPDAAAAPPSDLDAATSTSTPTSTPTPTPTPTSTTEAPSEPADAGPSFDMTLVFGVYKEHKDALRAACWDRSKSTEKAYIGKATIRLGPTGKLISSKTDGTDDVASACVDKQIKKWKFPPPNGTATIVLPIHMHRD